MSDTTNVEKQRKELEVDLKKIYDKINIHNIIHKGQKKAIDDITKEIHKRIDEIYEKNKDFKPNFSDIPDVVKNKISNKANRSIERIKISEKDISSDERKLIALRVKEINSGLSINEKIKKIRLMNKKTQEEFAQDLDISTDSIKQYEKGRTPSVKHLCEIARQYNVTTDYLLGLDNSQNSLPKYIITSCTDLSMETQQDLLHNIEDGEFLFILNYLFSEGIITDFVNLIRDNIQYSSLYRYLEKKKEDITDSVNKLADIIKWQNLQQLSETLYIITKYLANALYAPKDFLEDLKDEQFEEYAEADDLILAIMNRFDIFKSYSKNNDNEESED